MPSAAPDESPAFAALGRYSCLESGGYSGPAFGVSANLRKKQQGCCYLQVAAGMMGGCLGALHCAARMMLFVGGPSTEGGGKVVDKELSEPIRSHKVCPSAPWQQQWHGTV